MMFFIKAAFYRVFQTAFRLALPVPKIVDSLNDLPEIFRREKRRSVLIVTDKGIVAGGRMSFVQNALQFAGIAHCHMGYQNVRIK